jgi:hypothetical protein
VKQGAPVSECKAKLDFLRHVANPVLATAMSNIDSGKAPITAKNADELKRLQQKAITVLLNIKENIINGEIKYDFSVYGGNPANLAKYLESPEWRSLIELAFSELKDSPEALRLVKDALLMLLSKASEAYSNCPEVVESCKKAIDDLSKINVTAESSKKEG